MIGDYSLQRWEKMVTAPGLVLASSFLPPCYHNVKEFTQAYTLLTDEMETANLMEPQFIAAMQFIVLFITALTKTSVNDYSPEP